MKDILISTDGKDYKPVTCSNSSSFQSEPATKVMTYKGEFHVFENEKGESLMFQTAPDHGLVVGTKYQIKR